jgi:hypothetical protein
MPLAKTTEPAASRIPSAAEFVNSYAGTAAPNVETLRCGPNLGPLNASLAVTSRTPLNTHSLSAECMAQCVGRFLLCVFALASTNFTWTYSPVTGKEALTLASESLSTTTECETCALIRPERAQSKLPQNQAFVRTRSCCRHRNSFNFAARLVGGGRTVHPVSRVFRSVFHVGSSTRCFIGTLSRRGIVCPC